MMVLYEFPPMIDEMDAAFDCRRQPVFYAWGDVIYNPHRAEISQALHAHEAVHGERQGADIEGWWKRYIADPKFRLAEEIPAHRAEFGYWLKHPTAGWSRAGWRSEKHYHLHFIASRLASQLYGGLISLAEAKREVSNGRC